MSGTTGGGVTVPTIPIPISMGGTGNTTGVAKANSAGVDPGVTDDSASGYSAGSLWTNTSTNVDWLCLSPSAGAAVWIPLGVKAMPRWRAGRYYSTFDGALSTGVIVPAASTYYAYHWDNAEAVTITTLNSRIATAGTSSWMRAGIWRDVGGLPYGATVGAYNNSDKATTAAGLWTASVAATIQPGSYFVITESVGTVLATMQSILPTGDLTMARRLGRSNLANNTGLGALSLANPGSGAKQWTTSQSPTFDGTESWTDLTAAGAPIIWVGT